MSKPRIKKQADLGACRYFRASLFDRSGLIANLAAGISLAAMNIPQAMGYARIAGTPVITGLYTLLLPLVGFCCLGIVALPCGGI